MAALFDFHHGDEVFTKDGHRLGRVHCLHRRLNEIRPEWQQYGRYLYVVDLILGDDYYVPTDFVASRDAAAQRVELSVTFKQVRGLTWTRMPDFIRLRQADAQDLPRVPAAV